MRTAFIETLCEVADKDDRIWLLTGDLGYSVLERFEDRFPERCLNVGVAEQNMTGVAAGLALSGKIVFTYSIANFPTLRCLEQIRNDVCYHNANVKIVAVGAGFAYGAQGYTHHAIEDLAIMRTLPNMTVIAPGDPVEVRLATRSIVDWPGPCYLRLGRAGEPVVHQTEPDFHVGKPILVRDGKDVALLSTGSMLKAAVDAANRAVRQGYTIAVYSCPFVKPLDMQSIQTLAERFPLLIVVEEAQISGGFGGAVAELLAELPERNARLLRVGVPNTFLREAHNQESARSEFTLDAERLSEVLLQVVSSTKGQIGS